MYNTNILKSDCRKELSIMDKSLKKSQRRLRKEELRLNRNFERMRRCQSMPPAPDVFPKSHSLFRTMCFFLTTLTVAVSVFL